MSATRRIMVCLPESLVEEMDCLMEGEKRNRSELMREALRFYLEEKRKSNLREQLRHGYVEMAQINLKLAQEACYCEEEADVTIKKMLVECC
ncbi:MAG: ribbon-helix-helix protein, CopG family [Peptococcia bacterium]